MELTHSFTVPVPVPEAWATFEDISSVAACFPGAVVTSVEGDTFEGTCKVKLGPIALQYGGTGTFLERDEAAGRLVLKANGKDKRGNGTAGATVTATFAPDGDGTRVQVVTDLAITGKAAQFGRGNVMQDVSDKLLGQFVDCLQAKVSAPPEAPVAAAPEAPPAETPATETPAAAATAAPAAAAPAATPAPAPPQQEALDLGATVLPIILRTYAKQLAGGVVLLLLVRWLLRRRS